MQKDIAKKIIRDKRADYVLALKGNHSNLCSEIEEYFKTVEENEFKDEKIQEYRTKEKGHGHIEERIYYYSSDIKWMDARKELLLIS